MGSKRELLATVEKQKEQIVKYEGKLKDVVRAYKGLLKEKEALETSLSALAGTHTAKSNDAGNAEKPKSSGKETEPQPQEGEDAGTAQDHPKENLQDSAEQGSSSEVTEDLRKKLSALTAGLNTLTSEKKRIEQSFQNDKKRLLAEKEKLEKNLQEALDAKFASEVNVEEKIQDLRSRLIIAQHERDQDAQNAAVMLRELESKLAVERNAGERLEASLDEAKHQLHRPSLPINHRPQELYEKKISDLQNELEQVRSRLKKAEQLSEEPPLLRKIQGQMEEMRTQHNQALQQELSRASAVEESARDLAQSHEERVVALEARLADLSLTVASYDRTRQEDLHAIHKLKEKVSELAQENSFLASRLEQDIDNSETDVNALCRRLTKLKEQLITANLHTSHPVDVESLLCGGDNIHVWCQQEYDHLKEEFEYYKISSKEQSRVVGESACKGECGKQLEDLRQKIRSLTSAAQLASDSHSQQVASLRQSNIGSLEATAALLSQVSGGNEGPLLHHLEELARKDQEISHFRREKRQLETTMREVQMAALVRQQAQQDTIEALEEEAERHRRNVSRESENFEYLKNVVLQYMISSDAESRQLMLNAISVILKFTDKEVESVKRYNALWWWQPAPRSGGPRKT
ncbi:GRIP and coiled-coil domain-containing protein 1-like isoform X2 [Homarus americanus]|uniref:GRIP and coiled-coil domain-containing protein 1-like isoform X2 n=1 Tax=Homarus americanus TaxID=6706 RepID=UPI001C457934|nr:GRIP and coiled-coil domain-containing protein 1-like isoform X2 [Homarus americanus]